MRGAWRQIWFRYPGRKLALAEARVEQVKTKKDGSRAKKDSIFYKCESCLRLAKGALSKPHKAAKTAWTKAKGKAFKAGDPLPARPEDLPLLAVVDHKEALVPVDGRELSWDEYLNRLFCIPEDLQVLCDECHSAKSKEENSERRQNKTKRVV